MKTFSQLTIEALALIGQCYLATGLIDGASED
jgi:hypothetical protein